MSKDWLSLPLGAVLWRSGRTETPSPDAEYREVTVRLWGKGAVLRRVVSGASLGSGRRFVAQTGQLILSRIDARNGAIALVPEELHGALVTNDFPLFEIDRNKLEPEFLGWLVRTRDFVERCQRASEGTTNRVRLQESRFLTLEIPLPPLTEQRRIVAKIEELAGKIEETHELRRGSITELEALLRSTSRQIFISISHGPMVSLETVCAGIVDCLHSNPVYADEGIPTIRSPDVGWGTLLLTAARRTGMTEYVRRTRRGAPQPGDIILVREGGGTGKAGIVEDGQQVSLGQRVMQLRPNGEKVLPRFLLHQWLSPLIQEDQIGEQLKGSASPHLNIGALRKFGFLLPPLSEQRRIVAYLDDLQAKIDQLKSLQAQTAAELEALLPSVLDKAFRGEL